MGDLKENVMSDVYCYSGGAHNFIYSSNNFENENINLNNDHESEYENDNIESIPRALERSSETHGTIEIFETYYLNRDIKACDYRNDVNIKKLNFEYACLNEKEETVSVKMLIKENSDNEEVFDLNKTICEECYKNIKTMYKIESYIINNGLSKYRLNDECTKFEYYYFGCDRIIHGQMQRQILAIIANNRMFLFLEQVKPTKEKSSSEVTLVLREFIFNISLFEGIEGHPDFERYFYFNSIVLDVENINEIAGFEMLNLSDCLALNYFPLRVSHVDHLVCQ